MWAGEPVALERFVAEPTSIVKKNLADVIGSLAMTLTIGSGRETESRTSHGLVEGFILRDLGDIGYLIRWVMGFQLDLAELAMQVLDTSL